MPGGPGRLGLATVAGRSMEPTLRSGDRLVVLHRPRPAWVRAGRLAVVRLPDAPTGPRPLSVKRITGRDPDDPGRWWVERDNPTHGVDSWLVGGLPDSDVVALVVARLPRCAGPFRRGRLKGPGGQPEHGRKG
jgi:signal peptidase I